jgi:DNA-binding NarL/FixJ family response regulator
MATSLPLTVLLVDDHFVVRSGLTASLELDGAIQVVGAVERGENIIAAYDLYKPHVVMMDLQLPGINGIAATAALRAHDENARVLIFSNYARADEIQEAFDAGALGFLQKSASRSDLLAAIGQVADGRKSLSPEIATRLNELRLAPAITQREREIMALIAKGRANKQIAVTLGISEDATKRHVSTILEKLNVDDRAQATAEAIRRGILKVDP